MNKEQTEIEQVRARIHSLRSRLHDIAAMLRSESASGDSAGIPASTIALAAQAIDAVSEDLESACAVQADGSDPSTGKQAAARALSEVTSGEYDTQG